MVRIVTITVTSTALAGVPNLMCIAARPEGSRPSGDHRCSMRWVAASAASRAERRHSAADGDRQTADVVAPDGTGQKWHLRLERRIDRGQPLAVRNEQREHDGADDCDRKREEPRQAADASQRRDAGRRELVGGAGERVAATDDWEGQREAEQERQREIEWRDARQGDERWR